jgi:HAD superfamily hydrolase (TIGR01549 family)
VYRAILFDLDDTLLVNPMERFLPAYFQALSEKVHDILPADEFLVHLIEATQAAIANTEPQRTIEDVFWAEFSPALDMPKAEIMPLLEEFYANDYPGLQAYTQQHPEARPLVEVAFGRGFDVAIATNPLFPRSAVVQRLEWAGVSDFPYALVTTYENMHFTKPHPEYYLEIAERIGHAPEECLMVGNELENDIQPAAAVGMSTFWVTDAPAASHQADATGSLPDVVGLLGQ